MARLHEYQGKSLLAANGFVVPRGAVAQSPEEAAAAARTVGGPVVVKIQAWTTGRAALGGVAFADTPEQAGDQARRMLALRVGQFPVTHVLVEEKIAIDRELFVSLSIDDRARQPAILLSLRGGSGIEERGSQVARLACDPVFGVDEPQLAAALSASDLPAGHRDSVAAAVRGVFALAKKYDARSVEINPLVITRDGRVVAADCRMTIDDYAVFRQPELGIDIARELDHPPTDLERIAYAVEQADHRGTFYFAQLATEAAAGTKGLVGFHGAGGGGSMMSMDAITNEGFTIANFTDTSGNPSAAKVYRAARIILSQPGLCGYFGSGSGVASQEQFWSAYGLAKAFWELELTIPAVIRLGGNSEERAIGILQGSCKPLATTVEGYGKDDTPARIGRRFTSLVQQQRERVERAKTWVPRPPRRPKFVGSTAAFSAPIKGGRLWIDGTRWSRAGPIVATFAPGLLKTDGLQPTVTLNPDEFADKDSELIAAEVECRRAGVDAVFVDLQIPGLA